MLIDFFYSTALKYSRPFYLDGLGFEEDSRGHIVVKINSFNAIELVEYVDVDYTSYTMFNDSSCTFSFAVIPWLGGYIPSYNASDADLGLALVMQINLTYSHFLNFPNFLNCSF